MDDTILAQQPNNVQEVEHPANLEKLISLYYSSPEPQREKAIKTMEAYIKGATMDEERSRVLDIWADLCNNHVKKTGVELTEEDRGRFAYQAEKIAAQEKERCDKFGGRSFEMEAHTLSLNLGLIDGLLQDIVIEQDKTYTMHIDHVYAICNLLQDSAKFLDDIREAGALTDKVERPPSFEERIGRNRSVPIF